MIGARYLCVALMVVACGKSPSAGSGSAGSGSAAPTPGSSAPAAAPAAVTPDSAPAAAGSAATGSSEPSADVETACTNACTDYAVCWEDQNKGEDFRGGSQCERQCEERTASSRVAWIKRVAEALRDKRCKQLLADGD